MYNKANVNKDTKFANISSWKCQFDAKKNINAKYLRLMI